MKITKLLVFLLIAWNSYAFADSGEKFSQLDSAYLLAQNTVRDAVKDSVKDPARTRVEDPRAVRNDTSTLRGNNQSSDSRNPVAKSGVQQCRGEFALCASSTCKLTGRKIEVNVNGAKSTKSYPEVICKCPIITKEIAFANGVELSGLAGVNEGNMKGSCAVPSPDKIWSLFSPLAMYPQESASPPFQQTQQNTFSQQTCSTGTGSNCWSFLCTRDKETTNGTKTASCACPAGENPFGAPTQNSEFLTGAGSQYPVPQNACSQYPVSIPNIADYKK